MMRNQDQIGKDILFGVLSGMGDTSSLIEDNEKAGQAELVASDLLPREIGYDETLAHYESIGIVLQEGYDDLFVRVRLPDGWTRRAKDHVMWSEIVDEQGTVRINVFYKASSYDYAASMHMLPRYYVKRERYADTQDDHPNPEGCRFQGVVIDRRGEIPIFEGGIHTKEEADRSWLDAEDRAEREAFAWLQRSYPEFRNPVAYW